ncbi:gp251 [Bacillus phage W.Ph.]|uniref:Gp251 n=1 Tax=Bacillus phage W.Ph. TaxID=764595 RepID=G9B202_9CAUD|nr:gp251 [Bacillus phage W.Ph.]ADH03397.1 gp251 [Bacillus phage W.Ph.]
MELGKEVSADVSSAINDVNVNKFPSRRTFVENFILSVEKFQRREILGGTTLEGAVFLPAELVQSKDTEVVKMMRVAKTIKNSPELNTSVNLESKTIPITAAVKVTGIEIVFSYNRDSDFKGILDIANQLK